MMKINKPLRKASSLLLALLLACGIFSGSLEAKGEDNTVYIDTVEDLAEFADNCSLDTWSRGKTVILRSDISLANVEFENIPIFCGVFDGGGHTVSGFSLTGSVYPAGLFGIVQDGATVKNLNVKGSVAPAGSAETVGGIVGLNNGTLISCAFTGSVSGESSTGGIAGINGVTGILRGCSVSGGVFGQHATAGIAGTNLGLIEDCKSSCYVNISSVDPTFDLEDLSIDLTQSLSQSAATDSLNTTTDTGGIAGYSSGVIKNCSNSGAVGYRHIGYNVGGIAGRSCGYITLCNNSGAVYGRKDVGGVCGQMEPYIDITLSLSLIDELDQEINDLSTLIGKTVDDADASMQSLNARLDKMADYMDAAADAIGDIKICASVNTTASASLTTEGSASGEIAAPSVSAGGGKLETSGPATGKGDGSINTQGAASADSQISVDASQYQLSAALSGLVGQMRLLNSEMSGASTLITDDVRAINSQMDKITSTAEELYSAAENPDMDSVVTDSSDENADSATYGKALSCSNGGTVCGDIDVGGIAGSMAIDYALDPEDDVSSELSSGARSKYELKVIIQSCKNIGSVTAKKDCAGAICGRMDMGLITGCEGYGSVNSESGNYVGGVVGLAKSTVRQCFAKCTLSGCDYIGGIIGAGGSDDEISAGSVVAQCYSLVEIENYEQHAGAISGSDLGLFSENYFVSDTLSGFGRASYFGRAEPIDYEQLLKVPGLPSEFRGFSLKFVADGVVIDSVSFDYGDSFDGSVFPDIPKKDGCYAEWDAGSLDELHFDTTVTAIYKPYITALSSAESRGSGRPIMYVEGDFSDGDGIETAAQAKTPDEFGLLSDGLGESVKNYFSGLKLGELPKAYVCREIVEQWRITVPKDGGETHTVRYLSPDGNTENLKVYTKRDGEWSETDFKVVGSYLTFELTGEDSEIAVLSILPVWWVWLLAALLPLLIIFLIVMIVKKIKRRGGKQENAAAPATDVQDENAARAMAAEERLRQVEAELNELKNGTQAEKYRKEKPVKKRGKAAWIILTAIILLLAAAVIFYANSGLKTEIGALRLLRDYSKRDALSMELSIEADIGGKKLETQAMVYRAVKSGHKISCVSQDGVSLYHCEGNIILENGKVYDASSLFPDYSELPEMLVEICGLTDAACVHDEDADVYTISADGSNAKKLTALLLPGYADQLSYVQNLSIELVETDGELTAIRFNGGGAFIDAESTAYTVKAELVPLNDVESPDIPQAVIDAITADGDEKAGKLDADAFRLIKAWFELDSRDPLYADVRLSANCGPLLMDDKLEYFRTEKDGLTVNCVRKDASAVYFTDEKFCLSDGASASTSEESSTGCAKLLQIAYEACMDGEMSCGEASGVSTYKLSLDGDGMKAVASLIAPDSESLDIDYESGSIQVTVIDETISSIRFSLNGNMLIVLKNAKVSLSGALSFETGTGGKDCSVPELAVDYLKK